MAYQFPATADINVGNRYPGLTENQQSEAWSSAFPYTQLNPDGTVTAYYINDAARTDGLPKGVQNVGEAATYKQGPGGQWQLVDGSQEPAMWTYGDSLGVGLLKGAAMLAALYGAGTAAQGMFGLGAGGTTSITPDMLAAANATSDPIAALNASAGWTAADPSYLASITSGLNGTPTITPDMLAAANATSDPIAALNASAGWTAVDPAYLATLTAAGGAAGGAAAGAGAATAAGSAAGTAAANSIWPEIIKGGIGLIGGIVQNNQGKNAVDELLNNALNSAGQYKQAGTDYATGLRDLIPGIANAYSYMPASVNNGVAQTFIDPNTGQVSYQLNAPFESMARSYLGASQGMMNELAETDPNAIAKRMYDERMALIAPQREQQQQGLLQELYNKGGYGLSLNTPTQGGTQPINPYVNSFAAANAQQDRSMAYDAWNQGQGYLDSLIGRQRGLFGDAMGIFNAGTGALNTANQWGATFNNANQHAASMMLNTQRDALGAERDATWRYIDSVLNARNAATGANAAGRQATTEGLFNVASNLPWDSIWTKVSGLWGN